MSDVVNVAWQAAGQPKVLPVSEAGLCARCGLVDHLTPVRHVVSRNFAGFDSWCYPWRDGICPACCWAYRTPLLRTVPHLIVRYPAMVVSLAGRELRATLARPLTSASAIVLPLRPGRKHVISGAAWGHIATDNDLLPWTEDDAARLDLVDQLRTAGFTDRSLFEPAPPYPLLRALPTDQIPDILNWWDQLEQWRHNPVWLQVALKTARTPAAAMA